MIVLKETEAEQEIRLLPVEGLTLLVLVNEADNSIADIDITMSIEDYYLMGRGVFDLKEDNFYTLKGYNTDLANYQSKLSELEAEGLTKEEAIAACLSDFNKFNSELVIYERIFCTNQSNYDINKDGFNSNESNNDYIII